MCFPLGSCWCSAHPLVLFYAADTLDQLLPGKWHTLDGTTRASLLPFLTSVIASKGVSVPRFVASKLVGPLLRAVEHGDDAGVGRLFEFATSLVTAAPTAKLGLSVLQAALEEWCEGARRAGSSARLLTSAQMTRLRDATKGHSRAISDVLYAVATTAAQGAEPNYDTVLAALTALSSLLPYVSSGEFLSSRMVAFVFVVIAAAIATPSEQCQRCGTTAVLLLVDVVRRKYVRPSDKALVIEMGTHMLSALQVRARCVPGTRNFF